MKQYYKEILNYIRPTSFLSNLDNKIAAFIVYKLQYLPLTANQITIFSLFLVLIGILFLFLNFKILFIIFLILAYTFDNVDGIWARLKNQTSEFGKFFDGFMDSVKYFIIDIVLIIFYFDEIQQYVDNPKILVMFFSLYFIFRGLYYLSFFAPKLISNKRKNKFFLFANPAERYIIIFPLIILRVEFFIFYLIGFFALLIFNVSVSINRRFKYLSHRVIIDKQ